MNYRDAIFLRDLAGEYLAGTTKFKATIRGFECRCPICHDSRRDSSIMRGAFIVEEHAGEWLAYYKCLNGGCPANKAIGISRFFQMNAPDLHIRWLNMKGYTIPGRGFGAALKKKSEEEWKVKEAEHLRQIAEEEARVLAEERNQLQYFVPLSTIASDDPLKTMAINEAIAYCRSRLIPERVWRTWFVAYIGKYVGRIIIPFYRLDERPSYYQSRAIRAGIEPKYKNRPGKKELYNITFVDWTRPVHVLEGAIDSVFVENSFALNGVATGSMTFKEFPKDMIYLLQDNDRAGKDKALKMLADGYAVFLWGRFFRYIQDVYGEQTNVPKDMNDVVKATLRDNWTHADLAQFFTHSDTDNLFLTT